MNFATLRNLGLATLTLLLATQENGYARSRQASAKSSSRSSASVFVPKESAPTFLLTAGPGIVSGGLSLGVGIEVGAAMRISKQVPIYVGLDTFTAFGARYSIFYGASSSVGVGVLATGFYDFTIPRQAKMHVLGGMSTGVYLSSEGLQFALFVRPGFRFDFNPRLAITGEPVVGLIGSGFAFFPRALLTVCL